MTDPCAWLVAQGSSCAEALGLLSGAICVYLVTRENIWSWPLGIVTAAFYIVVFSRAGLYSETGLQVVYIGLSCYGWWHWLRGGPTKAGVVVTRVPARELLLLGIAGVALWLLLWAITSRIPGATLPLLDAALVSTSLVAQYLMTRKFVENWLLWIIVDVLYVWLYYTQRLRLTAVLYAIYLGLAILGYIQWKRSLVRHSVALS